MSSKIPEHKPEKVRLDLRSTLGSVLDWIEGRGGCASCPLYDMGRRPLVVKPSSEARVKAVVVTESPWEPGWDVDVATSIMNIPTFPYLYCLFRGMFRPREDANVYWTHVCKCPLKNVKPLEKRRAMSFCSKTYLKAEIEAAKPLLAVAVGRSALSYFARETGDSRLKAGLEKAFLNQTGGIYEGVRLGSATFSLAVAPHPSGKSRFWNRPPEASTVCHVSK